MFSAFFIPPSMLFSFFPQGGGSEGSPGEDRGHCGLDNNHSHDGHLESDLIVKLQYTEKTRTCTVYREKV